MDVIVRWRNGTENCVSIKELKPFRKGGKINEVGANVKMYYEKRWYYGTVVVIEQNSENMPEKQMINKKDEFLESDDEPLANEAKRQNTALSDEEPLQVVEYEEPNDPNFMLPTKNKKDCIFSDAVPKSSEANSMTKKKCAEEMDHSLLWSENCCEKDGTLANEANCQNIALSDEEPFQDVDYEEPNDPDFVLPTKNKKGCILSDAAPKSRKDTSMIQKKYVYKYVEETDHYKKQCCEVPGCENAVFSTCVCLILLCYDHFIKIQKCEEHQPVVDKYQLDKNHNDSVSSDETVCVDSIDNSLYMNHPENSTQVCEVAGCEGEVVTSCFMCHIFLCVTHFSDNTLCEDNHQISPVTLNEQKLLSLSPSILVPTDPLHRQENPFHRELLLPEHFEVEGAPKEVEKETNKRFNKQKYNKKMRDVGKEYVSAVSKKTMPARQLSEPCNSETCKKFSKECYLFDRYVREDIFLEFWAQGNLQSQREYIARYVERVPTKRKTAGPESIRKFTVCYKLPFNGISRPVCKKMFLSTLNVGEKTVHTTLNKITPSGTIEKDKRGGRREVYLEKDKEARALIQDHIRRFPKVESHYCREKSTREYLHSDLTLKKMYEMFLEELKDIPTKPSYSLYREVFKSFNLSFHRPKKDMCSLCVTYHEGSEEIKTKLREKYTEHFKEKLAFRKVRAECKTTSRENPSDIQCATFDLQQVISLPISNESAVFYKRRLSCYNFTIYDITSGECFCFTWHEGDSKRGSCEISTALYTFLKRSDENGIKKVYLFADGCSGQNKNTITASTLMYIINNSANIEDITLRFSIPGHGQSEGDSAHSAITYALKKSGDVFIPSQLIPIFTLARRKHPYKVIKLQYSDILNFKKLSTDLKILTYRKSDAGDDVNWTEMVLFRVLKDDPASLYFTTRHEDNSLKKISVKRNLSHLFRKDVAKLHEAPPKISIEKYNDLLSLTTGETPVIKLTEYVEFYKSLPH